MDYKGKQGSLSVEGHYGDKGDETGFFKVSAVGSNNLCQRY